MASERFTWSPNRKRYRDHDTEKWITERRMRGLRDRYIAEQKVSVRLTTSRLASGEIGVGEWERQMRESIKRTHGAEYVLGRGGRSVMTQSDWGRLGRALRTQYQYLNRFAKELADGTLTEAQAAARAELYIASATQAFERGRERAHPQLQLPGYPADGKTRCLANCKCHWDIRETKREYRALWTLGVAEHCTDCLKRARDWAPYRQRKAA